MTVMSLVDDGHIGLETTARELLGSDLPLIDDGVTVEHLLSHRSGIGDYLDEDAHGEIDDYVMPVPVHQLASTEDYLPILDGHPAKFAPGTAWSYCNGGYVILALLAERASGMPFDKLVDQRVCQRAGLLHTSFPRSDEIDGSTAHGYLATTGLRTNVLHLPVRGSGDGGIASTADDVHRLWRAFGSGAVVSPSAVERMTTPHDDRPDADENYGLGIWLRPGSHTFAFEGYDAGVSFRSVDRTDRDLTYTVISNTSDGAWPMTKHIASQLAG
jgi:CubicO group peptidase (beta-lactamase class C family)